MRALHRDTGIVLGHLDETRFFTVVVYSRETRRFRLTPVPCRRPAEGAADIEIRCGACGQELLLRARSAASTARVRRRLLVVALAGLAVAAAAVVAGSLVHLPLADPLGKLVLVVFLLALPVAGAAGWRWWKEDGLRLHAATGGADRVHWRMDAPVPVRAAP
ncbi:hypothetical protein GCM10009830_42010 [Glycomyces endophyticus]|uniref:Uncharacterized protein n=1 Tax=Glycomyces endophyticus TaxID=480996 RepID=A0ABN2HLL4_9ACTN